MLRPPPGRPGWHAVVGWILVVPAFVLLLTSYVEPLYWNARGSFQNLSFLDKGSQAGWVGFHNYGVVFERGLGGAIGRALLLGLVPLAAVLVLAPVLAWLAHRGGTAGRWAARGVLALPVAAYAPTAAAIGLQMPDQASSREYDPPSTTVTYWLTGFGLAAALGVTIYLAALRRREAGRNPVPALLVAGAVAGATVLALALQSFTVPFVSGAWGRKADSRTPLLLMYEYGFGMFRVGTAAAVATVLLLILMLLGLGVTLLLVLSRARLEFDDTPPPAARAGATAGWLAGTGVLVVLVLGLWWLGVGDWLTHITDAGELPGRANQVGVNTWVPPLISAAVGVTVAALAAFGISGLRPLGTRSEWLLVPFGLFLFVGVGPLAVREFAAARDAGMIDKFLGLVPPGRVAIPALLILALLLRGQAMRRETALQEGRPASWARTILPVLPMVLLAYLVTWVVAAQDLLWGLLIGGQDRVDAQNVLVVSLVEAAYNARFDVPFAAVLPIWALVLLVLAVVAAQLAYLDRVALRVGAPERDHPPRT
ncbi:sugar ABC transporter permease [Dactylosporangium sp. AC04546]|uniref:sugar ABC transporter permease n=1 Tax=Dactylosporangium sp. AC04546 TaxID=2862460 RepID=UPI002E7C4F82|nr:sugar ABC transporter permease [Dactylosporangium sp. AC04546]WVK88522.1 sugar ABC transporter permease [Dactylosporangium sp. AC04546]